MGPKHLNAAKASTVFDLGMGTGKVAMQVFLQFPNLIRVYGVELSRARFALGEAVGERVSFGYRYYFCAG